MDAEQEKKFNEAIRNPQNMGEMSDADRIGTVGNAECGDMLRMWIKFREKDGKRVIDKASFQSFGCETAIAVASFATQKIIGKTANEALSMSGEELSSDLGPLPPMKIHCTQMVTGALKDALDQESGNATAPSPSPVEAAAPTLLQNMNQASQKAGKVKIVLLNEDGSDRKS